MDETSTLPTFSAIDLPPPLPKAKRNYYRAILRRRMPWFLVAFLFLIWAKGIYENRQYFSNYYPPNALETSLTYLDHTLRLDHATEQHPAWIRTMLEDSSRKETLGDARDMLELFEGRDDFNQEATRALAVIRSELGIEKEPIPEIGSQQLLRKINSGKARWWDVQLARRVLADNPSSPLANALASQEKRDHRLFLRTAISYGSVYLIALVGLFFVPHAVRVIRRGWPIANLRRPMRYSSHWEPSLVIALFLAGDLLADWLIAPLYLFSGNDFLLEVLLDGCWRLLAPALALVILFRKPSHAIRSLGLDQMPDWKLILAAFSLLWWFNTAFGLLVVPWSEIDPTGGIDLKENGWSGLAYGLLSACILAPIAEEIFYRGLLLRGLEKRLGFWLAATAVSLAFAFGHHYDAFGLISVGIFGFTMAVIYQSTRVLTTTVVLHALFNFAITLPTWLQFHMD